jgi:hypothetical protein
MDEVTELPPNRGYGQPGRSGPVNNQNARKSGAYRARGELKELVYRAMDGRTTEAREVADWIGDLESDLGGVDNLSTQRRTLVALAGQTLLQIRRVDAFLARMPSMIHRKRRQLYPLVIQRQTLVNTLRQLLHDLGLDRQAKQVPSLQEYLQQRTAAPPASASAPSVPAASPTPDGAAEETR